MRLKHLETCPCGSQLQVEVDGGSEEVWEMVNCSVLNWRQLHRRHLKVDIAP
jgi:hypothetical protein